MKQIFDITSKKKVIISQIFFWKKFLPFRRKKLFKKILTLTFFHFWILIRGEIDLQLLFRALLNPIWLKKDIDSQTLEILENFPKINLFERSYLRKNKSYWIKYRKTFVKPSLFYKYVKSYIRSSYIFFLIIFPRKGEFFFSKHNFFDSGSVLG